MKIRYGVFRSIFSCTHHVLKTTDFLKGHGVKLQRSYIAKSDDEKEFLINVYHLTQKAYEKICEQYLFEKHNINW